MNLDILRTPLTKLKNKQPVLGNLQSSIDARIKQAAKFIEDIERNTTWYIERYESKKHKKEQVEYETKEAIELFGVPQKTVIPGNIMLNEGINNLWTVVCSSGGTKYDASNSYLGVGDSTAAEAATQTGLLGTNKTYKAVMSGYPTYGTNQKASWKSSFDSADANYAWNEFSLSTTNSNTGINLNRKVSSQGTKQSGQTWELTLEVTLS